MTEGQEQTFEPGECSWCGLSPYHRGIGDTQISAIVHNSNNRIRTAREAERAAIVAEIRRQGDKWEGAGVADLKRRYAWLADYIERGEHVPR